MLANKRKRIFFTAELLWSNYYLLILNSEHFYFCRMLNIPANAFSMKIEIKPSDIDDMNHVNNVVYTRWIQDISIAHWKNNTIGVKGLDKLGWFMRRHEIDFLQQALLNDKLEAFTWPEFPKGLKVVRNVVIVNTETKKIIMKSHTTWVMVNLETGRPVPMPDEIANLFK